MSAHEEKSFCRICPGQCGAIVELDASRHVRGVRPDPDHPISNGYFCFKGLQAAAVMNSPERLLRPLKRLDDGTFAPIELETALQEIAARSKRIRAESGADSIAAFRGTQNYIDSAGGPMLREFMQSIGSTSYYSTMTIDQSAKWVTVERLGMWDAGKQPAATSDVQLLVGTNPLISMSTFGFVNSDPVRSLKAAKARGMKLIVIDPRRSETARYADVFLQLKPGEDVSVLAGLLHLILSNEWHDRDFCSRFVANLDALRTAVAPFTPDYVAQRAGVDARSLRDAAELFAHISRRGIATSGTGPDMGPHSNLAEHLVECLNVVCGRYLRAGERVPNPGTQIPTRPFVERVIAPRRGWETALRSHTGYGMLFGERMSAMLSAEILRESNDRVRALFVVGGNPAVAFPDQRHTMQALQALDLLVTIDPRMTATARLSHYILPPKILYERADLPNRVYETATYHRPFNQYSGELAAPPVDAQLVDDWYVFKRIAELNEWPLHFDGVALSECEINRTEDLLKIVLRNAPFDFDVVRKFAGGKLFDMAPVHVQPDTDASPARFAVAPDDVVRELFDVRNETARDGDFRLAVRRMRDVVNTTGQSVPAIRARHPYNPASLHPDDMLALQLREGDAVRLSSDVGAIEAIVHGDASLRRGVVSLTHGWGDGVLDTGTSPNRLIAVDARIDPINAMPQMTGLSIRIEKSTTNDAKIRAR